MKRIPVIIDCDPGVDDVLALLLALRSPELEVLGITTVCGNSSVENASWNATRAFSLADCEAIAVYPGLSDPLCRPFRCDPTYCGEDGLCCSDLEGCRELISDRSAISFLRDTLAAAEEPVTIISIAGMTNLARIVVDCPEVTRNIREIVTVAGYYWSNPSVARVEWNILFDPEAAQLVFASGIPIRAIGLDVTAQLKDSYAEDLLVKSTGTLQNFLKHSVEFIRTRNLPTGGILVDAMAVAAIISPELAHYMWGTLAVNPGHTDEYLTEYFLNEKGSVLAAKAFDFTAFLKLMTERVISA